MKKIKTLLVDDDYLVLRDLKRLVDWSAMGFQITDTAANGKRAMEIAEREMPDLIVSDISMPVMDGFDFIEELKRINPEIYIIFISSYASFDYARRALQNHIHSYILKNEMTEESLTKELLQARSYILRNEFRQKEQAEGELKAFFEPENGNTDSEEEVFRQRFVFFFMAPHVPLEKLKAHFQYVSDAGKGLYREIGARLREICQDAYIFCHEEFVIAAVPWESLGKTFSYTGISKAYRRLQEELGALREEAVQIYTIPAKMTAAEGRSAFYQLLPYLHFLDLFPAYAQWDMTPFTEKAFAGVRQGFRYECIKKSLGHPELFSGELKEYTDLLFEAMDGDGVLMLYHNLILQLEELSGHMVPIAERNLFSDQEELTAFFDSVYREVQQYLNRKGNAGYAPWLADAVNYMKNSYADSNLTVEQIAETAGLSVSRFSVLFRQETGQTVKDYLTEIRISQAVFLLENSNCKIYEIAEKVGYKSSQYFSQIFSQKTGYKPLHFRKKRP